MMSKSVYLDIGKLINKTFREPVSLVNCQTCQNTAHTGNDFCVSKNYEINQARFRKS